MVYRILNILVSFWFFIPVAFSQNAFDTEQIVVVQIERQQDFKVYMDSSRVPANSKVHLVFNRFPAGKINAFWGIRNLPFRDRVYHLTLRNMKISERAFPALFGVLDTGNLHTLRFIRVEAKVKKKLNLQPFAQNLEALKIWNSDLPDKFYQNFTASICPHLKHLEIINSHLKKKFAEILEKSGLLPQLEYINLSQNKLTNRILGVFRGEKPWALKTLILNSCDLSLSFQRRYTEKSPALARSVSHGQPYVDWNSPVFQNLTHLEIEHLTDNYTSLKALVRDTTLFQFHYVEGFKFYDDGITDTRKLEEKQRTLLHLQLAANHQARWNNYEYRTLEDIQKLRESSQFDRIENLTFSGSRWQDVTVRLVLEEAKPPHLKHVALHGVSMTQEEVYRLIHDYPQYTFDFKTAIVFDEKKPNKTLDFHPDFWPRLLIKKED